ncbi:hypothetical protein M2169_000508 [Streptomyces sp. MJP52]|nr:hypothetical protein [Streptomyces sp. MJP52]
MHHTALITEASSGPGAESAARPAAPAGRGVHRIRATRRAVRGTAPASPERVA